MYIYIYIFICIFFSRGGVGAVLGVRVFRLFIVLVWWWTVIKEVLNIAMPRLQVTWSSLSLYLLALYFLAGWNLTLSSDESSWRRGSPSRKSDHHLCRWSWTHSAWWLCWLHAWGSSPHCCSFHFWVPIQCEDKKNYAISGLTHIPTWQKGNRSSPVLQAAYTASESLMNKHHTFWRCLFCLF